MTGAGLALTPSGPGCPGCCLGLSRRRILGSLSGISQSHRYRPSQLDVLRPSQHPLAILSEPHLDFEKGRYKLTVLAGSISSDFEPFVQGHQLAGGRSPVPVSLHVLATCRTLSSCKTETLSLFNRGPDFWRDPPPTAPRPLPCETQEPRVKRQLERPALRGDRENLPDALSTLVQVVSK